MTTERSDNLFKSAQDAQQKFDYFVLGISGALCAFIGQSFEPQRLGFNPSTLELLSLLMLVASAIKGFRRIESCNSLMRVNGQYLRLQEERGVLVNNMGKTIINNSTGDIYSADQISNKTAALEETLPSVKKNMENLGSITLRHYKTRNLLLLLGFLLLLGSKVWGAYV